MGSKPDVKPSHRAMPAGMYPAQYTASVTTMAIAVSMSSRMRPSL
jgi:hypothetical protein